MSELYTKTESPRGRQPAGSSTRLAVAISFTLMAAGTIGWALIDPNRAEQTLYVTAAVSIGCAVWNFADSKSVFHPLCFPNLYLAFVCIAPLMYVFGTGETLGRITVPGLLPETVQVFTIFINGFIAGSNIFVALRLGTKGAGNAFDFDLLVPRYRLDLLESIGRGVLFLSLLLKGVQFVFYSGLDYGSKPAGGMASMITTAAEGLLLIAVLLIVVARISSSKSPISSTDLVILSIIAAVALFGLGSRSELIAPVLLIGWGLMTTRRLPAWVVIAFAFAFAQVSNFVGNTRTASYSENQELDFFPRLLIDLSSPIYITNDIATAFMRGYEKLGGESYLNAIPFLLPGLIARKLFDEQPDTASFLYREMIGFTDSGTGFAFALPSEAFLNYGVLGVGVCAVLLGAVLIWSFSKVVRPNSLVLASLYPLLLATLPYGYRSDFLGHSKMVVYPLLVILIVSVVARQKRLVRGKNKTEAQSNG